MIYTFSIVIIILIFSLIINLISINQKYYKKTIYNPPPPGSSAPSPSSPPPGSSFPSPSSPPPGSSFPSPSSPPPGSSAPSPSSPPPGSSFPSPSSSSSPGSSFPSPSSPPPGSSYPSPSSPGPVVSNYKNNIIFENTSNQPIYVHLDASKPPCGVGKYGACNPPDDDGNCVPSSKEYPINGSSDMDYDSSNCTYSIHAKNEGRIKDIWGDGPKLSGTKSFVIDKYGSEKELDNILPVQLLNPNEKWRIQLPISNDGSGRAMWCFKHDIDGSKLMECSGAGAWFTPANGQYSNTEKAFAPMGVQRVEYNVNTKNSWKNWVLNLSAVDGINSNVSANINNNGNSCINFNCPIDLNNCPSDNKGTPTLSMDGHDIKYPSCMAPKLIGKEGYNTKGTTNPCTNLPHDQCWAAAASGKAKDKLSYHQSWDYTSKKMKDQAKIWKNFIRPNEPGNSNNCETYIWAYDEQVCSTSEYNDKGNCSVFDSKLYADNNPYAPLGNCNVYNNDKYSNPYIHIKVNHVMN